MATGRQLAEAGEGSRASGEILSERLLLLLDDILAGQAPNAGRFCGHCYHPLAPDRDMCAHCARSSAEQRPTESVPRAVKCTAAAEGVRASSCARSPGAV